MAAALKPRPRAERVPATTFLLVDLTPATRRLFQAYRDACRATVPANERMTQAHGLLCAVRNTQWHLNQNPGQYPPDSPEQVRTAERMAAATEVHQAATAAWQATVDTATKAFHAAVDAMEAEGYDRQWWTGGVMRMPKGVVSPGRNRPYGNGR